VRLPAPNHLFPTRIPCKDDGIRGRTSFQAEVGILREKALQSPSDARCRCQWLGGDILVGGRRSRCLVRLVRTIFDALFLRRLRLLKLVTSRPLDDIPDRDDCAAGAHPPLNKDAMRCRN
jgi:hypothetical protein